MKQIRKVRSLLDDMSGVEGVDWEWDTDIIPGMGFGATEQAVRWARLGSTVEILRENNLPSEQTKKRLAHRPAHTSECQSIHFKRAALIFLTVEKIRQENGISRDRPLDHTSGYPLRRLINEAKARFETSGIFDSLGFGSKMTASIKRGREMLGIMDGWRGLPPEEMFR